MENILFIVSFTALALLILSRVLENKLGKFFMSNLFAKGDYYITNLITASALRYNYYKKVAHIFVFDFIPALLYEMLVKSKDYVARRYYNAGNEFRGRRILRSDGSVSSFLERLSEDNK